jgi:phosphoglycolate phosphatase-like HAD superfamily hydrolase
MAAPAVILDIDGTLIDSNDAHARAWMDAFSEAGVQVDSQRVRRAIGMGSDKLMPQVSGISEESPEGERISSRRGEIFRSRYLPHIQPFPRVRDLIERFNRDGFTIVVATSAAKGELAPLLERAGVADLIESSTSSDDAENSKPDPDIVAAALKRSKAASNAAVMLGDTPYDVTAARRTGVAVVGVESGGWRRNDLSGASEVYANAADLLERYDGSIFARLKSDGVLHEQPADTRPLMDMNRVLMIAAGVAGVALLAVMVRAMTRRPRAGENEDQAHEVRPGLSPRERERLRRIIERTS